MYNLSNYIFVFCTIYTLKICLARICGIQNTQYFPICMFTRRNLLSIFLFACLREGIYSVFSCLHACEKESTQYFPVCMLARTNLLSIFLFACLREGIYSVFSCLHAYENESTQYFPILWLSQQKQKHKVSAIPSKKTLNGKNLCLKSEKGIIFEVIAIQNTPYERDMSNYKYFQRTFVSGINAL